ncbi:MAG: hypothetical protein HQL88_03495 [Magnetococcales bacterium]|nr:hypothetical protein [Magnetococcales bacterium]
MTQQEILEAKLRAALYECAQHDRRLHAAWLEAVAFTALQGDSPEALTEAEVRTLDQLIFRFARLQDSMGTRLLPSLLHHVLEWHEHESFLDTLNRAEKRGIIPSANRWVELRRLRNQTAHAYPERPEWVMANLRGFVSNAPCLEEIYRHIVDWAKQHVPLQ